MANLVRAFKERNGGAYDQAEFIEERVLMIQQWSDYLDRLAAGAEFLPFKAA